jgi:proteasome lid subunit RPN8/RPN11
MIRLLHAHVEEMYAHAREARPAECCGLVGGTEDSSARSVYRLRNIASDPLVAYESAPEDLFSAQRSMRERGEYLIAIYHSHPGSNNPRPSETDVRLAYYPSAVYLIIGFTANVGFTANRPFLRAFSISESERRWAVVDYEILPAFEDRTTLAGIS